MDNNVLIIKDEEHDYYKSKYRGLVTSKEYRIGRIIIRTFGTFRGFLHLIKSILKGIKVLFTQGPSGLKRSLSNAKNKNNPQPKEVKLSTADKLYLNHYSQLKPITTFINEGSKRINLVVNALDDSSLFGGMATAIVFATKLAQKYNTKLRIITTGNKCNISSYYKVCELFQIEPIQDVQAFDASLRYIDETYKMDVTHNDIFIATIWWTAYIVNQINLAPRFIYLVQEYEPVFYPEGDEKLLTMESYAFEKSIPVLNTSVLKNFLSENKYKHIEENALVFEPSFEDKMYKASKDSFKPKDKYKLFFYARASTLRNLFYRGINILDRAITEGIIDTNKWDIYFAGEEISEFTFSNGAKPIFMGKMNWQQYNDLISTMDLGLSLMFAPHPSYPPLDLISSGAVVVTNNYSTKSNLDYSKNLIMADSDIDSMIEGMKKGVELAMDLKQREENYKNNKLKRDWNESFAESFDKLKDLFDTK